MSDKTTIVENDEKTKLEHHSCQIQIPKVFKKFSSRLLKQWQGFSSSWIWKRPFDALYSSTSLWNEFCFDWLKDPRDFPLIVLAFLMRIPEVSSTSDHKGLAGDTILGIITIKMSMERIELKQEKELRWRTEFSEIRERITIGKMRESSDFLAKMRGIKFSSPRRIN